MSEMRLRDYGYQTKKNDVLRERALTSAFSEKGAGWVNKQLRNMMRVARESESRVIFLDMCRFIGSSTDGEIRKTMKVYDEVLEDSTDHTTFLDSAVFQIGWRNVYAWLDGYFCNQNDEKNTEKIKKDMDYVIEVHSHRKKVTEQMAMEQRFKDEEQCGKSDEDEDEDEEDEEESDEYKDLDDEDEEHGDDESISLRDYGYSVHKTQRGRIGALKRAIASEGMDLVCARLERLGQYHHVMLEDLETLRPSDNDSVEHQDCKCVSAQEIRNIVREELSKVFGDLKKMNEEVREMYIEMIV
jgi:uncharacterized protein YdaU (DUF1376 family)